MPRRPTTPSTRFAADPEFLSERRPLRPAPARRRRGAARRAPAVPHRHRHRLARPARRADDRARLLRAARSARPGGWPSAAGADVEFVEADVYDALDVLGAGAFDLVFTGIGALCWLPDIRRWAQVVAGLLRPGGRLFIREGHPMLWALDESRDRRPARASSTRTSSARSRSSGTTAAPTSRPTSSSTHNVTHEWNHGLGEIVTALLDAGHGADELVEHDSVPWDALPGQMEKDDGGEWRLTDRPWRLRRTPTRCRRGRAQQSSV